jgi:hypothetical protein
LQYAFLFVRRRFRRVEASWRGLYRASKSRL